MKKVTLTLCALSLITFTAGAMLARFEVIPPMAGLGLFVLGGALGLLTVASATTLLIMQKHYAVAMAGMIGFLPLMALVAGAADALRYPAINDVSTDLEHPPEFTHANTLPANEGRDMTYPDEFNAAVQTHYPAIEPLTIGMPPEQAYERAVQIAARVPRWEITHRDPEARKFEAVAKTNLFHFRDDVVVRVDAAAEEGESVIHMRSKSRKGKSDLGANARRIRSFLDLLRLRQE